ncbi:MAG: acetoin utilization protein AcuC [Coriobacteriia bacterium]|nr:acetoin utilization protein AcuC [Coriobacteriia bacterium]
MDTALVYTPALDSYDFGPGHPLRPERVSLAVHLLSDYGLTSTRDHSATSGLRPLPVTPADAESLLRVHDPAYVEAVMRASVDPGIPVGHGIGPGDTPAFAGMHEAAALIAGASWAGMRSLLAGEVQRVLAPAGGLHHAHRDRAAGFCVYNDAAVAIASALAHDPRLRIAYIDIDAHHGDGAQEAFYAEPRVLTVSLHQDGRYLYPGTGSYRERGVGSGTGTTLNVPLPPYATPECYLLALDGVVAPAVRAYSPDILVTQNGADAHWSDPLTALGMTIPGYELLFTRLVSLAEEATGGRMLALGGGGYSWRTIVPRVWALLGASLLGETLPARLPQTWRERVRGYGAEAPDALRDDPPPPLDADTQALVLHDTAAVVDRLRMDLGLA